jgi:hypothetical protein
MIVQELLYNQLIWKKFLQKQESYLLPKDPPTCKILQRLNLQLIMKDKKVKHKQMAIMETEVKLFILWITWTEKLKKYFNLKENNRINSNLWNLQIKKLEEYPSLI